MDSLSFLFMRDHVYILHKFSHYLTTFKILAIVFTSCRMAFIKKSIRFIEIILSQFSMSIQVLLSWILM